MGKETRGKRDGTGPYKLSYRKIGRRIEAGENCPAGETKFVDKIDKIKFL